MAWRVYRAQFVTGDAQRVAVVDRAEVLVGMGHSPEHFVGGVQEDRGVQRLTEFGCDGDVVVVAVGAHHRHDVAPADRHHDGPRVMRCVEHHDLRVVADDRQHIVVAPLPQLPPSSSNTPWVTTLEWVRRSFQHHHRSRPAPRRRGSCGRHPRCRRDRCVRRRTFQRQPALQVQADQVGKSRPRASSRRTTPLGSEPPREKKSINGISSAISGVGTPTAQRFPPDRARRTPVSRSPGGRRRRSPRRRHCRR